VAAVNDFTDTSVSEELADSIFRVCTLHEFVVSLKNITSHYVSAYLSIRLSMYLYVFSYPSAILSFVRPFIHPQLSIYYSSSVSLSISLSVFLSLCNYPPASLCICILPNLICPQVSSPVPVRATQLYL
jgi:hypothetical protein